MGKERHFGINNKRRVLEKLPRYPRVAETSEGPRVKLIYV